MSKYESNFAGLPKKFSEQEIGAVSKTNLTQGGNGDFFKNPNKPLFLWNSKKNTVHENRLLHRLH